MLRYIATAMICLLSVAADHHAAIYSDDQPVLTSSDGELAVTLVIGQAIFENTKTNLQQKVVGYNGHLGGPTLRVLPGDTLKITLENQLPEEACNTNVPEMWNSFHALAATNLHTHGLFVPDESNPTFVKVQPGESLEYTIAIPESHQGGTHWYHPHVSGSTTLQAGGGAAGLLIVEDLVGDLPEAVASLPEITMRIQFFNFTYLQQDFVNGRFGGYLPSCAEFCLPEANRPNCSVFFFQDGPDAGEYNISLASDGLEYETLTVNGVESPTIQIAAGQWYRLRTLYVPTTDRTIEPSMAEGCDFKLLAKDGVYIPVAPRDIHAAYMSSGNRADFLLRCNDPGTYEFESLMEARTSSNWIASQKPLSLKRTMAVFEVNAAEETIEPKGLPEFKAARPCYLPDMTNLAADEFYYFIQGGLTPPLPKGEAYPEDRPTWESRNISFSAMNAAGVLSPPNEEYLGPSPPDFEFTLGTILEIDYFAPQLHPLHMHIFPFQVIQLPKFDGFDDFFQVGDYHDVLMVPIGDDYAKAVMRSHITEYVTPVYVHCHIYSHSDGGMAMLGQTVGTAGAQSDKVQNCYTGLENRGYELLSTETTTSPPPAPNGMPGEAPTDEPQTSSAWNAFAGWSAFTLWAMNAILGLI